MNKGKLGFGLMRLPLVDPADTTKIDYATMRALVDRYLEAGFNYFDTAAPYHGGGNSEVAFRECVAKRYPRSSYTITDKLSLFMVQTGEDLETFFQEQLERCGVDRFDYYLLHSMTESGLEKAEHIGAFDFLKRKLSEGAARHIGFSFHDKADVLEKILSRHPEMEYVQLQINYADWENPGVQSRACYETAVRHGKKVLVMEPVKGGLLANLPEEAEALLKESRPDRSITSWAVRFAASLPEVTMALSGMSDLTQMEDNLSYMGEFEPLIDDEKRLIEEVVDILSSKESIACTGCRYCVDDCPKNIAIPDYFKLMNEVSKFGEPQIAGVRQAYAHYTGNMGFGAASSCIKCGKCEHLCPQHLPVRECLDDIVAALE